jgi:hypothetical protein
VATARFPGTLGASKALIKFLGLQMATGPAGSDRPLTDTESGGASMDGYYVEVWQSDGEQAEEHSTLQTFEGAMDWIMSRKFDDAGLKGRITTRDPITLEQQNVIQRFGVQIEAH